MREAVFSVFVIILLLMTSSCGGGEDRGALSDENFRELYTEIIFIGELYRGDTLRIRAGVDSLLRAYGTDTTALFAAARRTAQDKELTEALYLRAIERFESITAADTLRGGSRDGTRPPPTDEEDY